MPKEAELTQASAQTTSRVLCECALAKEALKTGKNCLKTTRKFQLKTTFLTGDKLRFLDWSVAFSIFQCSIFHLRFEWVTLWSLENCSLSYLPSAYNDSSQGSRLSTSFWLYLTRLTLLCLLHILTGLPSRSAGFCHGRADQPREGKGT